MNRQETVTELNSPSPWEALDIPSHHKESLRRTLQIASLLRQKDEAVQTDFEEDDPLTISVVNTVYDIPPQPGAYLIEREADPEFHHRIESSEFSLTPTILSGKVDSGHAVLPGVLTLYHSENDPQDKTEVSVAAKGFYKRSFMERLERVQTEVTISKLQEEAGELAFKTVAVVIAPAAYRGKYTDYSQHDLLLVTRLNESMTTLDNAPWQLGFKKDNLELAEEFVSALARFNTTIGKHGDAKVKNAAQSPEGKVSMIDFETSEILHYEDPLKAAEVVFVDLGTCFDSLEKRGFFSQEPHRVQEVLGKLAEVYLEYWSGFNATIQESVLRQASNLIESYNQKAA